jgi:hypothetical protein
MKEKFLHFLWRYKRFDVLGIHTTKNQLIEILYSGDYNTHSGPDFLHARLKIGNILWIGNVEIHVRSSEWINHRHQDDKAYDNVILHVVFEEDTPIFRNNGERIPCLQLKKYINENLLGSYEQLLCNTEWIPCQNQFAQVSEICKTSWWERLLIERMEEKTSSIISDLQQNNWNWEEVFYRHLARSFGIKNNELPFEMLARALPLSIIRKHKNRQFQIEALFFGQAGMLENENFTDAYPKSLKKEFQHLQNKYSLKPINNSIWKFLRMRPASFPTIRIAEFAAFITSIDSLFSTLMEADEIKSIESLFELKINLYWENHFTFDKLSVSQKKQMGKNGVKTIIINTICPFLFTFGKIKENAIYQDRAFKLLEQLDPEQNHIINKWVEMQVPVNSAEDTQALIQQKRKYCDSKRCLECAIGTYLLREK